MNLKQKLCEFLLNNNLVKENDVIKHSYSKSRLTEWKKRGSECNNIAPTLDTRCDCLGVVIKENNMNNLRIRKLSPTECFRLMGVKDEDSEKLNHLSNSVKYHLAGDSIVVNVLEAIFKSILIDNPILDKKPIRLIEFFSGYGSQALALKYLNIPFEHWKTCEWAIKSIDAYKHIHFPNDNTDYSKLMSKDDLVEWLYNKGISSNWNEPMKLEQIKRKSEKELRDIYNNIKITKNLVNIQQVHGKDLEITEREMYNYILTYSFPCQDLSLAGKGAGMEKGSGTRSGMLWEVERILQECDNELPQLLLMENVPQVVGKKNKDDFDKWVHFLETKGYTSKYCMLNGKEIGYPEPVPQNRNRCFMISVLNPKTEITFPQKTERTKVLKDILEEDVDEKYYLSDEQVNRIAISTYSQSQRRIQEKEYVDTLCARDWKDPKCAEVNRKYGIFDTERSTHQAGSVYDENGLSPTLDTMQGGYRQPCIEVNDNNSLLIEEPYVVKKYKEFIDENGYIPNMYNPYHNSEIKAVAPTQTTNCGSSTSSATILKTEYKSVNKALQKTLENNKIGEDPVQYIDAYNRKIKQDGLAKTITTRVDASNNDYVLIKNNTKQGYLEARDGDGVNIQSRMKHQRGNVQNGITQTLTTSGGNNVGVVISEKWSDLD